MIDQHRDVDLPFPRHHTIEFGQTIVVMLHHRKVDSIIVRKTIVRKGYPKKLPSPLTSNELCSEHDIHINSTSIAAEGIVSIKSLTLLNC